MKKGRLFGVGIGPGDPELLTVKAVRLIREADLIVVPDSGGEEMPLARKIAQPYLKDKPVLNCSMPMIRDRATLERAWDRAAQCLVEQLSMGIDLVFLTLGDPSIYSTYLYVHQRVLAAGFEAELIPGVPSFCAAAARLNMGLCAWDQPLSILPASMLGLSEALDRSGTKVIMKCGKRLDAVRELLREKNLLADTAMVEHCGLPEEQVFPSMADADEGSGYFSLLIVK